MLSHRDQILQSLKFQTPDHLPKDLGGMRSTGISAFAYPRLVAALGLPPCRPRVEDTMQMLALPDLDVLDALGCDVVTIQEWKDKCLGRITLWGGGVDAQHVLPLGTLDEVTRQVTEVTSYLSQDGGYVFCNIHNILAEIAPEKITAMYRAASTSL